MWPKKHSLEEWTKYLSVHSLQLNLLLIQGWVFLVIFFPHDQNFRFYDRRRLDEVFPEFRSPAHDGTHRKWGSRQFSHVLLCRYQ